MATHVKIQVPVNSTGEQLDTVQGTVTGITGNVDRQVMVVADPAFGGSGDAIAGVINIAPVGTEYGLITRPVLSNSAAVSITTSSGAGSTSQLSCTDRKSFAVQLTGTWSGIIVFEVNIDPTNTSGWVSVDVWDEVNEVFITSTATNGSWWCEPMGVVGAFRVRATAWSSGTATGLLLAGMGDMNTQETAAKNGGALPNNICAVGGFDGTNIRAISTDTGGVLNIRPLPGSGSTFAASGVDTTSAFEASRVIKASAGVLYGLSGYNNKPSQQFIMIFNSATVPADTSLPAIIITANPNSNFSWDSGTYGKFFSAGISVSNSSTVPAKTIGSGDCWFNALFS